jgi:hypothetical protein
MNRVEPGAVPDTKRVGSRWTTVAITLALGGLAGAGYAVLVGSSHLLIHGRWDHVPVFSAVATVVGAATGLATGSALAFTGWASPDLPASK